MTDIFAVEDEVNRAIIAALAVRLDPAEATKVASTPTTSIEAYEYFLRGRQAMGFVSRRSLRLAYYAFERAIGLDPAFAEAYASLAMTYALDLTGTNGSWSDWVRPPGRARAQAAVLADKASSLQPGLATPELVLARLSLAEWHYDDAIAHAHRALERQPGDAEAYATLALTLTAAGQHGDALQAVLEALRRDPRPPPATYGTLGMIQFALHDYAAAVENLGKSVEATIDGGGWFYSPFLLASYGRPTERGSMENGHSGRQAWPPSASISFMSRWKTCSTCSTGSALLAPRNFRPSSIPSERPSHRSPERARSVALRPLLRIALLVSPAER